MALASRTGGNANVHIIQHQDEGLIVNAVDSQIDCLSGGQEGCTVDMYGIAAKMALKLCHKLLFEHRDHRSILGKLSTGKLARPPEPHDASHILCPGPKAELLVVAAVDERRQDGYIFGV